jgi:drug/metabolite transporter (DMT)-like permease
MARFNFIPLGFGLLMAVIDMIMLAIIKKVSLDRVKWFRFMIAPTLLYAFQPWIFLESLKYETMVVMNLMFDVLSDILVTLTGIFIYGEKLGVYKSVGVLLSFISIIFMSLHDDTVF